MDNITEIFCAVDDFFKIYQPKMELDLITDKQCKRIRPTRMSPSEMVTIMILFHRSNYRTFKHFYLSHVSIHFRNYFPTLLSYNRFVQLQKRLVALISAFLNTRKGNVTGLSFIDSTSIKVCHNKRIKRHKVFAGIAARAKSTMGWFYGFKLHLVVNHQGELLSFCITPGNTDDRAPLAKLAYNLWGKLFGDRGYISRKATEALAEKGVTLITSVRRNMKNHFLSLWDKFLLRKRFIIETINDQLKNIMQIEHSRHRNVFNFMVNLAAGLVAYTFQEKKPSLDIEDNQLALI